MYFCITGDICKRDFEEVQDGKLQPCIPMEPGAKLSKFNGGERVDASRYQSLVGSLCYITCTRLNLSLSIDIISRFMEEPVYSH